jgi:predicted GNAT family acetyltransferase
MSDVMHDTAERRFQIDLPEGKARLDYREEDGHLVLLHTGVPESAEGEGHGSALVRAALDHARDTGLRVVPQCPFARAYVERHPEFAELVAG